MVPGDPAYNTNCIDRDQDAVPDAAETWELGLNPIRESTDLDKFDDGQELFGITQRTGGALPRTEDVSFIGAEMPSWVKAPGNHPLVAAYPVPTINAVLSSFVMKAVTTVTTERTVSESEEHSYSTSKTEGTSTSNANTITWNEWDEQSVATTTPMAAVREIDPTLNESQRILMPNGSGWDLFKIGGSVGLGVLGVGGRLLVLRASSVARL